MFPKRTAVGYRSKKSRLGKKLKNHTRLLIVVGVALLATVLTVIWGTVWGERAQESAQKRLDARREQELLEADRPAWLPIQPPAIRAPYAGKITDLNAAVANAVLLSEEGAEAISLPLYTDGTPAYDSPTAQILGRQQTGETGEKVRHLQYMLSVLDAFIPNIPPLSIDGIYGPDTTAAVEAAQRWLGLPQTGTVDATTWDEIYDQFSGIENRNLRSKETFPEGDVAAFSQRNSSRYSRSTTMTQFPGNELRAGQTDPISQEVVR